MEREGTLELVFAFVTWKKRHGEEDNIYRQIDGQIDRQILICVFILDSQLLSFSRTGENLVWLFSASTQYTYKLPDWEKDYSRTNIYVNMSFLQSSVPEDTQFALFSSRGLLWVQKSRPPNHHFCMTTNFLSTIQPFPEDRKQFFLFYFHLIVVPLGVTHSNCRSEICGRRINERIHRTIGTISRKKNKRIIQRCKSLVANLDILTLDSVVQSAPDVMREIPVLVQSLMPSGEGGMLPESN